MVVLSSNGVSIPVIDGQDSVPLGPPELLLIGELARGVGVPRRGTVEAIAADVGCEPGRLDALIERLEARRLLVAGGPLGGVPPSGDTPPRPLPVLPDADVALVATLPLAFGIEAGAFVQRDHDGRVVLRTDAAELAFLSCFRTPHPLADAVALHRAEAGSHAVPHGRVDAVVGRLLAAGALGRTEAAAAPHTQGVRSFGDMVRGMKRFVDVNERHVREREAKARRAGTAADARRVRVVAVPPDAGFPPLALGMVLAHAQAYDGGRLQEHFDFSPDWHLAKKRQNSFADRPGVFLFSNYTWSHPKNLERSAAIKQLSPWSVTVHGGPDTPRYEADVEAYFHAHPHVDIAVRGEGEVTTSELFAALAGAVGDGRPDLSALRDVPGLTFRHRGELVRTPDRERITDLDSIPSPYLTGLFDIYGEAGMPTAIIETNRGCPYSCSFCDWGSATLSRIRKFSLDRVFAELEWCARHGVGIIFVADANFGIMERDVEIAEKVAELRAAYGYPRMFTTNYAKNTVKHLRKIVQVVADAGVVTEGLLSLQSMDRSTLAAVNRSNIKVERYDELAREFRRARLPLFVDLMLGLPGQTPTSFRNDLQECVNREVTAKVYPTEILVNSPMNDPRYREEHQIEEAAGRNGWYSSTRLERREKGTVGRRMVVSTATFTRRDYEDMLDLRRVFLLCENFGVLRQVARWVRQETGLSEVELYDRVRRDARAGRDRWPVIALTFQVVPDLMVPPVSWRLFVDEVGSYLRGQLGLGGDAALDTVLAVQHALLPASDRRFPQTLELAHDFAGWHRAHLEAKDAGHLADWPAVVPHLRDLPPAPFTVEDETKVCTLAMGHRIDANHYGNWELTSPVARATSTRHLALA